MPHASNTRKTKGAPVYYDHSTPVSALGTLAQLLILVVLIILALGITALVYGAVQAL